MSTAEPQQSSRPHSADVVMVLLVEGREYPLAKVAPDRVVLQHAVQLAPCDAQVLVIVNHETSRHAVRLPEGANVKSRSIIVRDR